MSGAGTSKGVTQLDTEPRLVLCIKSQDGESSFYRITHHKKMQNLFFTYCKEKNLDYGVVKFFRDGKRIKPMHTPLEAEVEDGDEIDALVDQDGGGYPTMNP